jgi:hypothetical protein
VALFSLQQWPTVADNYRSLSLSLVSIWRDFFSRKRKEDSVDIQPPKKNSKYNYLIREKFPEIPLTFGFFFSAMEK